MIIPAFNAQDTIRECLTALQTQTIPRSEYEIIVVDDGSTDNTRQVASLLGVQVLTQNNSGPSAARNLGLKHARGEIVCFTDADCVPIANWLAQITRPLCESDVVAVKGAYISHQRETVARFVQQEYMDRYDRLRQHEYVDHVDTGAAAYRRSVLLVVGGFDEKYSAPSVEDQDLSFRLAKEGYKMIFAPDAVVAHRHPTTIKGYARRKFILGYWKVRELSTYPTKAVIDTYTPHTLKLQIILVPLIALTLLFRSTRIVSVMLSFAFVLSILPFLRKVALRDPSLLWAVIPLLMVRALAGGVGIGVRLIHSFVAR